MSKKRTLAESNKYNDEPTNEGSGSVLQREDNAKRAKLTPLSETTLQGLPIELLERILVEGLAAEVMGMKLAKGVWKEKVDPVISRLENVCSQWSSILSTSAFRNEVDRILDSTAEETIRLEVLHQSWIYFFVNKVTALKEEIFVLYTEEGQSNVSVYDRNNVAEVKDVIALPGTRPVDMEACNVSNCVYVLRVNMDWKCPSVLRITKDKEHNKFNILTWISDLRLPVCSVSVSPNGMLSVPNGREPHTMSIYNANGCLEWSADVFGFGIVDKVINISNGNLLVVSVNGDHLRRVLTEIDAEGRIKHQYESSLTRNSGVNIADIHGRIMISEPLKGIELLDSELNLLEFVGQQQGQLMAASELYYDRERNEVMSTCVFDSAHSFQTIFRFTEE